MIKFCQSETNDIWRMHVFDYGEAVVQEKSFI